MSATPPSLDELRAARALCDRWLRGHGDRSAKEQLSELPTDIDRDTYGDGGVVEELEREVATLLAKPAAVFMPSGTMAQQIALRIHADHRARSVVAFHPTSHLELHEDKAYQRLHGLVGRAVGDPRQLLTVADLDGVAEPLAALLLELPQREIGGRLSPWDEVVAQCAWARARGAAVHLDGARLWDCQPHYERPLDEIAGLFDSVYVSFYKTLGGLGGCCLAGEEDVVAEARDWRRRHGGTLFGLWPYAASALAALRLRLPRIASYAAHARAIGDALRDLDGVEVVPDPPVTPMMHIRLRTTAERFTAVALDIARRERVWMWDRSWPTDSPTHQVVELSVGDATLTFTPEEVRDLVGPLAADPA